MNFKSKYIVLAITLLLTLSSTATIVNASSSKGTLLAPAKVDTHGPRINAIDFSVIAVDSALASTLGTGGIQAAEWSFLSGSFASLKSNSNIKEGKTLGYTFDGIAFNVAQPIISSVHYREAIQYLTDYGSIQKVSLSGVAGSAAPYLMPCAVYPTACNTKVPIEKYNLLQAAIQLSESGLTVTYNGAAITTAQIAKLSTSKLSGLSWTYNGATWSPLFYYRNDDPLRSSVATILTSDAKLIGLTINAVGISDEEAGGTIYGASEGDVITNGGYCGSGPNAGYDDCPAAAVNETSAALAADNWDMYTFGWVTSSLFTFQGAYEWISSQVNNDNFNAFINSSMDYYGNQVLYAPTLATAESAAQKVGLIFAQQLPSIISFYQNYLFADYINGWTGFANEPTTGPNTAGGAYYTMLNVHPVSSNVGGTLNYGLHGIPDIGSLNPIAYPNWVWQADVYDMIYDAPLNTPPTQFNVANAYIPYMVQGTDPTAPAGSVACLPAGATTGITGCQVAPYNGLTPVGAFNFQNANTKAQAKIVDGQAITFTFAKNITFSDNVPVTAYDYNYSLYALNVAESPSLPTAFSPFIGGVAGPSGLEATTVDNGGYSITMYMNISSVWNVVDLNVPVLPMHVFNYLNINVADAVEANIDFSQPYGTATSAVPGSTQGTAPASITYLPNLNLASGPFWLNTINEATGSGILSANVNYFRTAWYDNLKNNEVKLKGGSTSFTGTMQEYIFNAGKSTFGGVAPGTDGYVPMSSANINGTATCTASAQAYTGSIPSASSPIYKGGPTGSPVSIPCTINPTTGAFTVNISPSSQGLTKGNYELTVIGGYTFLNEARIWYQFFGFNVH
jgi:hypothetical protein